MPKCLKYCYHNMIEFMYVLLTTISSPKPIILPLPKPHLIILPKPIIFSLNEPNAIIEPQPIVLSFPKPNPILPKCIILPVPNRLPLRAFCTYGVFYRKIRHSSVWKLL